MVPLVKLGWVFVLSSALARSGVEFKDNDSGVLTDALALVPFQAPETRKRIHAELLEVWNESGAPQRGPWDGRGAESRLADLLAAIELLGPGTVRLHKVASVKRGLAVMASSLAVCCALSVVATHTDSRPNGWQATYFPSEDLSGHGVTATHDTVSFHWAEQAPTPEVGSDHWSARFEGCISVTEPVKLRFVLGSDDGSRLYVDNQLVLDHWVKHGMEYKESTVDLERGPHLLRVEYFDNTVAATLVLKMAQPGEEARVLTHLEVLQPVFRNGASSCD